MDGPQNGLPLDGADHGPGYRADRARRRHREVMFDGGIRSGQDILRALAFGARSCMCGRAYIYGLGAAGQAGVASAIEFMRKELETSMGLTGITRIADIGRHAITSR